MIKAVLFFFIFFALPCSASTWMERQIEEDLSSSHKTLSLKAINRFLKEYGNEQLLVRVTIKKNKILAKAGYRNSPGSDYRFSFFKAALLKLAEDHVLPDTTFLVCMGDALRDMELPMPLFVMAKKEHAQNQILVPDFDALKAGYQVLSGFDITDYEVSWEDKHASLVWRGSTAQGALEGPDWMMREGNLHQFSRVRLCELSLLYPEVIDAKFTFFAQGGEHVSSLQRLRGSKISYEKQLEYKYHILIDGNTCAYSASGWKFFTNSLIFKPDSHHIQWYYHALKPGVHYVAIERTLDDLLEKIGWAVAHDREACEIAKNARSFAKEHLTLSSNLEYLYQAIVHYSRLECVDETCVRGDKI